MNAEFKHDYELLDLDPDASYAEARIAYRRLVNKWHPDRYVQRPRERPHAQLRFIELTKAYENLRGFHRDYGRLPFQMVADEHINPDAAGEYPGAAEQVGAHASGDGGRDGRRGVDERSKAWPLVVGVAACIGVVAVIATMLWFDRQARSQSAAEASKAVREAGQSSYRPSAIEVRRLGVRGAYVEGDTSPELGDQLMEDTFRQ